MNFKQLFTSTTIALAAVTITLPLKLLSNWRQDERVFSIQKKLTSQTGTETLTGTFTKDFEEFTFDVNGARYNQGDSRANYFAGYNDKGNVRSALFWYSRYCTNYLDIFSATTLKSRYDGF